MLTLNLAFRDTRYRPLKNRRALLRRYGRRHQQMTIEPTPLGGAIALLGRLRVQRLHALARIDDAAAGRELAWHLSRRRTRGTRTRVVTR